MGAEPQQRRQAEEQLGVEAVERPAQLAVALCGLLGSQELEWGVRQLAGLVLKRYAKDEMFWAAIPLEVRQGGGRPGRGRMHVCMRV